MAVAVAVVGSGDRIAQQSCGRHRRAQIDFRIVALGALMPDAIDKPLAILGPHAFSYDLTAGHSIGHTLIAALAVIAAGVLLSRRGEWRLLWLGLGWITHLPVDPVIVYPHELLWPAFGFGFPASHGIPPGYLRAFDVLLALTATAVLLGSLPARDWARRFLFTGVISEHGLAPAARTPERLNGAVDD